MFRFNFIEFVRVHVNGEAFENENGRIEGSRASGAISWRSRMDVVEGTDGRWERNSEIADENEIVPGHKNLFQNDPTQ